MSVPDRHQGVKQISKHETAFDRYGKVCKSLASVLVRETFTPVIDHHDVRS